MSKSTAIKALIFMLVLSVVLLVFGAYLSPTMAYYLEDFRFC